MNKTIIKTGFCVAYDWILLKNSLPRVYEHSDIICLALDKHRKSWAGNPYEFDDKAFYQFVKEIDTDNKIILIEEDFALPELNARQNGNRHRMRIAEAMGKGGWHIQVDADEYFLDFKGFTEYLKKLNPNPKGTEKPFNVEVGLYDLIKKTDAGYIYVDFMGKVPGMTPFATNVPKYTYARRNGHFNKKSPFVAIHETWTRSEAELRFKLGNHGHSVEEFQDRDVIKSFVKIWKALDKNNYQYIKNFHFVDSNSWPALNFCEGKNIEELLQKFIIPPFPYSKFQLWVKNNRNIARLKALWNRILKRSN